MQNGKIAVQVELRHKEVSSSAYDEIALSECHHVVARMRPLMQTTDDKPMNGILHEGFDFHCFFFFMFTECLDTIAYI